MNPKLSLKPEHSVEIRPKVSLRMSVLVVNLAVLSLLVLTACKPEVVIAPSDQVSKGPALLTGVTEQETGRDAPLPASVPEFLKHHPFVPANQKSASAFYAANPELQVVRRYIDARKNEGDKTAAIQKEMRPSVSEAERNALKALDNFLKANPELRYARHRFAAEIAKGEIPAFLAPFLGGQPSSEQALLGR